MGVKFSEKTLCKAALQLTETIQQGPTNYVPLSRGSHTKIIMTLHVAYITTGCSTTTSSLCPKQFKRDQMRTRFMLIHMSACYFWSSE